MQRSIKLDAVARRCARRGGASDVRLHDVVGVQRRAAEGDVVEVASDGLRARRSPNNLVPLLRSEDIA